MSQPPDSDAPELTILYDGACPFCSRFVALYSIRRNVGRVALLDARERPDLVAALRADGIDIDEGMVVHWEERRYFGADAMNLLALLGAHDGAFAAMNRLLFRSPRAARAVYPALVRGRGIVLRLMGRTLISDGASPSSARG